MALRGPGETMPAYIESLPGAPAPGLFLAYTRGMLIYINGCEDSYTA